MNISTSLQSITFASFEPAHQPSKFNDAIALVNTIASDKEDHHKLFAADPTLAANQTARVTVALHSEAVVAAVVTTVDADGSAWVGSLVVSKSHRGFRLSRPLVQHALVDRFETDGRSREVLAYVRILPNGLPNPGSAKTLRHNRFSFRSIVRISAASLSDRARFWTDTWADLALFQRPEDAAPPFTGET